MSKQVQVDREAEEEIVLTIEHYNQARYGLGFEFMTEVDAELDALQRPGPECRPVTGLPTELGVRRKRLPRFPYAIVFIEQETTVRVISVMHSHRSPAYLRGRI